MTEREQFEALLDRYWDLAHAEGKEGRDHDTEDGAAQETRYALQSLFRARLGGQAAPAAEPNNGEKNAELGTDSNDARTGQQRLMARALALGQLLGDRQNKTASNPELKSEFDLVVRELVRPIAVETAKNCRSVPQLTFAPIFWGISDLLLLSAPAEPVALPQEIKWDAQRQRADSWGEVAAVLGEVFPGWTELAPTGVGSAKEAIRRLAKPAEPVALPEPAKQTPLQLIERFLSEPMDGSSIPEELLEKEPVALPATNLQLERYSDNPIDVWSREDVIAYGDARVAAALGKKGGEPC
jgi:hypothetical protein